MHTATKKIGVVIPAHDVEADMTITISYGFDNENWIFFGVNHSTSLIIRAATRYDYDNCHGNEKRRKL